MALKVLMRKKELTEKQKQLVELRKVSETFPTREINLEKAIEEAETEEEKRSSKKRLKSLKPIRLKMKQRLQKLRLKLPASKRRLKRLKDPHPLAPQQNNQKTKKKREVILCQ